MKDEDLMRMFSPGGDGKKKIDEQQKLASMKLLQLLKESKAGNAAVSLAQLFVTRAELQAIRINVGKALNRIDRILREEIGFGTQTHRMAKEAKERADETTTVFGQLLATLFRKEIISSQDLIETAERYLDPEKRVVGLFRPERQGS